MAIEKVHHDLRVSWFFVFKLFYLFLFIFIFFPFQEPGPVIYARENADTFSSLGPLRVVLQQHVFVLEAQIKDKYPLNVCPYIYFKFAAAILR